MEIETKDTLSLDATLSEVDRGFYAPEKVNELTRKGVKRPLETIIDSLPEEHKAKMGRFVEVKLQEITMEMDEKEIESVDQKVDEKVNGPAKTIPFPLGPTPPEYRTEHDGVAFIIEKDGLIDLTGFPSKYVTSTSPTTSFPSSIEVKNNKTNLAKAMRIRKLVESGRTARAFLIRRGLLLKFGRTVQADLDYLPTFTKIQEDVEKRQAAYERACAFQHQVENTNTVTEAEFEARLTLPKQIEWSEKREELVRKLMRDIASQSVYNFRIDSWIEQ
jgi:hypothetical protein